MRSLSQRLRIPQQISERGTAQREIRAAEERGDNGAALSFLEEFQNLDCEIRNRGRAALAWLAS